MNEVTNVSIEPLKPSTKLKPLTLTYCQDGRQKSWDLLSAQDSTGVLLYNVTRNVFVFVRRFRPSVYLNQIPKAERMGAVDTAKYPPESGLTLEFCSASVGGGASKERAAVESVYESCGYQVDVSALEKIATSRFNVGRIGTRETLFYCEVQDHMKRGNGHEVSEMSVAEAEKYACQEDVTSTSGFLFAVHWFLVNKSK